MTITVLDTRIREVENKVPDHAKCITAKEFNSILGNLGAFWPAGYFDPK